MRCKLHPYANGVGVCAPCLRDRLLAVAAEQDAADGGHRSSIDSPPPAVVAGTRGFPRSVSPYVAHRRSDACAYTSSSDASRHHPSLLFFRTPQVGPNARAATVSSFAASEGEEKKKATRTRSFFAAIFGSYNHEKSKEPRRSTSWLSTLVRRKRRPEAPSPPPVPARDDGMSPERATESPGGGSWWFASPSPARRPERSHRRRHGGPSSTGDGISGLVVCLSPLVRPSSGGGHRRCQPPDPAAGGDNHRRHFSAGTTSSFGRNTSRKLADMGRFR